MGHGIVPSLLVSNPLSNGHVLFNDAGSVVQPQLSQSYTRRVAPPYGFTYSALGNNDHVHYKSYLLPIIPKFQSTICDDAFLITSLFHSW